MADLTRLSPPKDLSDADCGVLFEHFFRSLAAFRNTAQLHASNEFILSSMEEDKKQKRRDEINVEIQKWAQALLEKAWVVFREPGGGSCPALTSEADTSMKEVTKLPAPDKISKLVTTILFLHITATKEYSARTRSFLSGLSTLDEYAVVETLRNPDQAIEVAQKKTSETLEDHATKSQPLRAMGVGLGAIAGGILIGVTGGLAAPLVGAGVTTLLGWLGFGGTAVGLLASGLAGSSVVCGALFGAYGARSTANILERYTREVRDLAVVPFIKSEQDTLAVRLCISGWLSCPEDVTAPWTVFQGDDTFALQWEVEALRALSDALGTLVKAEAMKYVKAQIIKRTILASLMSSLAPLAWLKIGRIIDNPWMNAKSLALKTGAVLGDLISKRMLGNRPITLVGYSLGSLVIFEALRYLATLPPAETAHLVQDVFLFGTPTPVDLEAWSAIRRVVAGRLVNGYATEDYVLAVLSRVSDASWGVAGLTTVDIQGVENVLCEDVGGHTQWRGMIGKCLQRCNAPGIVHREVEKQMEIAVVIKKDYELSPEEAERLIETGPVDEDNLHTDSPTREAQYKVVQPFA